MSSNAFSADIRPDPSLRRLVLVSSVVLGCLGLGVIVTLDAGWLVRGIAGTLWLSTVGFECARLCRAWRNCRRVRVFPGGRVEMLGEDGEWSPGRLVGGGVLLGRLGWLRLRRDGGPVFAEPLRGDRRRHRDWRRLHVIWRHFGA